MSSLYEKITFEQMFGYLDVSQLSAEHCLHLIQDLHFYIVRLNLYHAGMLSKRDYERHFNGYRDINQMWDNVMSALSRLKKLDPSLVSRVPEEYLDGGEFENHPSTWGKPKKLPR